MKPRLLDLFCGAGGAAMGYHRAGFEVVGVDINPQPHYPFEFHQADALTFPLEGFDAYHASPPCQCFSQAVKKINRGKYANYIPELRKILQEIGKPYVIENVPQAPLEKPIVLCGSMFGLPLRRHRMFETNIDIPKLGCKHELYKPKYPCAWNRTNLLRVLSISGGYQKGIGLEEYKQGFGIDWRVTKKELSQSIPPAYTEYIGKYLMEAVKC